MKTAQDARATNFFVLLFEKIKNTKKSKEFHIVENKKKSRKNLKQRKV